MGRRKTGFTLLELLVVMAILGIALGIAVPSAREYINSAKATTHTNDFVTDLALARTEAARRGYVVSVCLSTGQTACNTGTNWNVGRIVFIDVNNNGTVDSGEEIIRKTAATDSSFSIIPNPALTRISFAPSGVRTKGSAKVTFTLCSQGAVQRQVTLFAAGGATTSSTTTVCS